MTIYTIGFSGKTQEQFIEVLDAVGIKKLIDVRLWRASKFAPWASEVNLTATLGDRYKHMAELAPTMELLSAYREEAIDWDHYAKAFSGGQLVARQVQKLFTADALDKVCFMCAEKTADRCHRRLVAEYLAAHFPDTNIVHL